MREKFQYLFKNSGYLLIGNFSSRILNFLLVPLYTYALSTEEYGSYDLIHTTILLLIPILSLNIADAIMRFSIEREAEYQSIVYSVAIKYTVYAGSIFSLGCILSVHLFSIPILEQYLVQTILLFWMMIINQILVQIARGLERIKSISISGVIGTFFTVSLNVVFLLIFKIGIIGYFLASIIALFIQNVYLGCKCNIIHYCHFNLSVKRTEIEMLKYCLPLIFTTLSWYINSVADRYTVAYFVGVAANGIYSVSYKIPAIMTAFQTIFIQSWQLSAVKEFSSEEGKTFVKKTYFGCQTVMILLCSMTILATRILAKILFSADFYNAWVCVPTLVFYVLFNTLSGTIGGVFIATKDSKTLMNTAIIGAIINILLNLILIYFYGILGAAIATAISSLVIWGLRYLRSKHYINWGKDIYRFIPQIIILTIQAASMTLITSGVCYLIQTICILLLFAYNSSTLKTGLYIALKRGGK